MRLLPGAKALWHHCYLHLPLPINHLIPPQTSAHQIWINISGSLHWRHLLYRHILNHQRNTLVRLKRRAIRIRLQQLNVATPARRPSLHDRELRTL